MYCKHCMKMIPDDSEFCPACGKSQNAPRKKPIYKRWWFWVIVVFLLIGIGGRSGEPEIVESNGGSVQHSTNGENEQQANKIQYITIGDTAVLNDVYVTFENATQSNGKDFFTPSEGNVFLICEFTIENRSNSELNISSLICFDAYVDDFSTNISLTAEASVDKGSLDGTIAAGKKMNGIIGYEVPADWNTLEIHFTPDFWAGDQQFIFACTQ